MFFGGSFANTQADPKTPVPEISHEQIGLRVEVEDMPVENSSPNLPFEDDNIEDSNNQLSEFHS